MTSELLVIRPQFRGSLHRWSVPFAIALMAWLAAVAPAGAARAGMIVYGLCVVTMLSVSGVYHLARYTGQVKNILRRIDHATILLAIAGSYTAVIVAGMTGPTRTWLLIATWVVAAVGIAMRVFWFQCPGWVMAVVYLGAGWSALLDPGAYLAALNGFELSLVIAGGLLYTVGSAALGFKWPNPWPATFGYHEVFHTFVVMAAFCHWLAVFLLVTR